jgi:beta-lactam-binding protein with PASTA domain
VEIISPVTVIVSTANYDLVPAVYGMAADEARQTLLDHGFHVSIDYVEVARDSGQVGVVISQSPEASTLAELGSVVTIRVGREPGFNWFDWWRERGWDRDD